MGSNNGEKKKEKRRIVCSEDRKNWSGALPVVTG
jgi:hypothetical protein